MMRIVGTLARPSCCCYNSLLFTVVRQVCTLVVLMEVDCSILEATEFEDVEGLLIMLPDVQTVGMIYSKRHCSLVRSNMRKAPRSQPADAIVDQQGR